MRVITLFNDFLRDEVNLNDGRVTSLETSIDAIENYIEGSDWSPEIIDWQPQGSWAHKTIIRPVDRGEFDADLLVFVQPVADWEPKDYINELYSTLKQSSVYSEKVRRWSHCVTITYANDKMIDIAPCVVNRQGFNRYEVCNRDANSYETTEPTQYTSWIIQRNTWSGANSFRKVTRLIKYLRDVKLTFTCSSILLTTMLGYRMSAADQGSADFSDTPTALKTMFGRWDDWLQSGNNKPIVLNPFVNTDLAASLTDGQYTNLRNMVSKYRGWIDEAYAENDRNESIAKWQRVFGEKFAKDVVIDEAKSVSQKAAVFITETAGAVVAAGTDLVTLIKVYGSRALPTGFDKLPHMKRPTWRTPNAAALTVRVRAELYTSHGGNKIKDIVSLEPLSPAHWVRVRSTTATGIPWLAEEFDVKWRITNTDQAAFRAGCLRGGFEDSNSPGERWEQLAYRGVHIIEAFIIRRRDNALVGQSQPFFVAIE